MQKTTLEELMKIYSKLEDKTTKDILHVTSEAQ